MGIAEWIAKFNNPDDYAYDQPCLWGHRVGKAVVFCHNPHWPEAPGVCKRSWHYSTISEEDGFSDFRCEGFKFNHAFDSWKWKGRE